MLKKGGKKEVESSNGEQKIQWKKMIRENEDTYW